MRELQHNIVNVLYTVKGIIESHLALVQEGRFERKEKILEHAHEVLQKAYERVNKALDITKRLGQLLKSEEKLAGPSRQVSLKAAWQETLRILKRECPLKGIEIIERLPEDFPLIQCTAGELQEILYNLLQNAIQAMDGKGAASSRRQSFGRVADGGVATSVPTGGSVAGKPLPDRQAGATAPSATESLADKLAGKLILRACLAFSTQEEPLAVITVADTGPGIPEKVLRRLFQPFFTTKPEGEGNGLGLYLVKGLVERNHGRISVSSYQGLGTTFTIEFPTVQSNEKIHAVPS